MPSFDIVSRTESHEILNAIDQANREVSTRFDFKDSGARYEFNKEKMTLTAPSDFQLKQMDDILRTKLSKRQVDLRVLHYQATEVNLNEARMIIEVKQGIDAENAKKIVKFIKDTKLKVQASILGDQIRIVGKKRDDLQSVIAELKQSKFALPLQFINFRD
jgi:cyclic-di-GMP-binding protein